MLKITPVVCAAFLFLCAALGASFAAYPDHPIQLIIPNVAGAQMDITGRMPAEEMEKIMGVKMITHNEPGAGTVLGAGDQTLVFVPFSANGCELLHREMHMHLRINALKHGRTL